MPNRHICDVLQEMRKAYESRTYVLIPGLIEEAQSMVNRMEAALYDKSDMRYTLKTMKKLKKEKKALQDEIELLEDKKEFLCQKK